MPPNLNNNSTDRSLPDSFAQEDSLANGSGGLVENTVAVQALARVNYCRRLLNRAEGGIDEIHTSLERFYELLNNSINAVSLPSHSAFAACLLEIAHVAEHTTFDHMFILKTGIEDSISLGFADESFRYTLSDLSLSGLGLQNLWFNPQGGLNDAREKVRNALDIINAEYLSVCWMRSALANSGENIRTAMGNGNVAAATRAEDTEGGMPFFTSGYFETPVPR